MLHTYRFKSKVWLYSGAAAWHFVSVPKIETAKIKKTYSGLQRGFGSFPVKVTIERTEWETSIFPDNKTETFLLPLKAKVRKAENIKVGQTITIQIEILAL